MIHFVKNIPELLTFTNPYEIDHRFLNVRLQYL